MIGGIGNMFVSVHCSECQSDEISKAWVNGPSRLSLKVARCPCSALNVKVMQSQTSVGKRWQYLCLS